MQVDRSVENASTKDFLCNSSGSNNLFLLFSGASHSFLDLLLGFNLVASCLLHNCGKNIYSLAHAGVQLLDHTLDVVLQKLAEPYKHDQRLF